MTQPSHVPFKNQSAQSERKELKELKEIIASLTEGGASEQHEASMTTFADVQSAIASLAKTLSNKNIRNRLDPALYKLSNFVERLDTFMEPVVQSAPGPAAGLVWGTIRLLCTFVKGREEVVDAMLDAFVCISDNLPRICSLNSTFGTNNVAISAAFRDIVQFLSQVAQYLNRSRLKQYLSASKLASDIRGAKASLLEQFRSVQYEHWTAEFKRLESYARDARFQRLLTRLDAVNYIDDLESRKELRLRKTCSWSTQNPLIQRWISDDYETPEARCLWLHGGPGTGKSVLAAYLIDYVNERLSPDETVVFFFCDNKDKAKRSSDAILRAFMTQLMQTRPVYRDDYESLAGDLLHRGRSYRLSGKELEGYLHSLVRSFTKTRFVIDALDECEPDVVQPYGAAGILNKLAEWGEGSKVKVLYLSRAEKHVHELLHSWPQVEVGGEGTTEEDIDAFVQNQVDELTKAIPFLQDVHTKLQQKLLQATGSMFLYVRLMVQNVIENRHLSRAVIEEMLERPPKGLHRMYEEYLTTLARRNPPETNRAGRRVLQWLTFSEKPMTLKDLDVVLAVDPEHEGINLSRRHVDMQAMLRTVLGILVNCRKGPGQLFMSSLVHQSFKDFLLYIGKEASSGTASISPDLEQLGAAMRADAANLLLLTSCCTIMTSPAIRRSLLNYYDSFDKRRIERPQSERVGYLEDHFAETGMRFNWKLWSPRWEEKQLQDLEAIWKAREQRKRHAQSGLDDLNRLDEKKRHGLEAIRTKWNQELDQLLTLEKEKASESIELQRLLAIDEREAIVYSQRRLSNHLAGARTNLTQYPAAASLLVMFYTFAQEALKATSDVAASAAEHILETKPTAASGFAAFVGLAKSLRSVPHVIAEVDAMVHRWDHAQHDATSSQGVVNKLSFDTSYVAGVIEKFIQSIGLSALPGGQVLQDNIKNAVNQIDINQRGQIVQLVSTAERTLSTFRGLERALYQYDEALPPTVGSSRLLYSVMCMSQSLARWVMICVCAHLHDDHLQELTWMLHDDDFFVTNILVRYEPLRAPKRHNATPEVQEILNEAAEKGEIGNPFQPQQRPLDVVAASPPSPSPSTSASALSDRWSQSVIFNLFLLLLYMIAGLIRVFPVSLILLLALFVDQWPGRTISASKSSKMSREPSIAWRARVRLLILAAIVAGHQSRATSVLLIRVAVFSTLILSIVEYVAQIRISVQSKGDVHMVALTMFFNGRPFSWRVGRFRMGLTNGDLHIGPGACCWTFHTGGAVRAALSKYIYLEEKLYQATSLKLALLFTVLLAPLLFPPFTPIAWIAAGCIAFKQGIFDTFDAGGILRARMHLQNVPQNCHAISQLVESGRSSYRRAMQEGRMKYSEL